MNNNAIAKAQASEVRENDVPHELSELRTTVGNLESSISQLESRLQPLQRTPPPGNPDGEAAEMERAPLAHEIRTERRVLEGLNSRVNLLLARIGL